VSNNRYDYDAMERVYVSSDVSLREIARQFDVHNHSLISIQSKKREWARKRQEFQSRATEHAESLMASSEGRKLAREAEVRDHAIDAIDEAIMKMREDMKGTRKVFRANEWIEEPLVVIKPQDVALLIDRLQVLFGKPSAITEERSLGVSLSATGSLGPDILRGIVEATRGLVPGDSGESPLPRVGGARKN
jgi:transposase-like protein